MEKLETTLIKHTKYIYEYENALDKESTEKIDNILRQEVLSIDSDIPHIDNARNNHGWTLSFYQKENKNILEVNQFLEKLGYQYLTQYYKDCPLIKSYHKPNGSIGSFMTYRVYDKRDQYDWHTDSSSEYKFLVSFILYLNDDFVGGDTLFLNDGLKVKPKKGSVLMFPCGPYFVHKSTPIKSGMKHIVWNCYTDCPQEFVRALKSMTDK